MHLSFVTSVKSNLANSRIAVVSPLAAANALFCRVWWAGTFTYGRYIIMGTSKVPHPEKDLDLRLIPGFLDPHKLVA